MGEKKIELQADYFREDYAALYYLSNAVLSKPVWYAVLAVIWTVVVLGAVYAFVFGLPEGTNLTLFGCMAAVLVFAGIYLPLYPSLTRRLARKLVDREYLEGKRRDNQKSVSLGKKGLEVESFGSRRFFPWSEVEKIKADQNHLLLFFQNQSPVLLPRKSLTEHTEKLLRERGGVRRIVQYP